MCDIFGNTFTRKRDMRRHKENVHEKGTGFNVKSAKKALAELIT